MALFRALFAGREDAYATRWVSAKSGRTGRSPAEDNLFAKNKNDAERVIQQVGRIMRFPVKFFCSACQANSRGWWLFRVPG
ncbi:hypothetical protein [Streptomyces scopuliridis]|uniref:TOTE conflict system archaeo-eukaryotic primase domain-containing protein n=1 Tax=Streptomyces scopuliridis TaxID=452529 RepID=UPI0036C93375